jgi:proteic killer suppression protein
VAIRRFRHKGLQRFFERGDKSGIDAKHAAWLRVLLTVLASASRPEEIGALPGTRLHPLKGERRGQWAVWVSGNWRLVFRFDGEDATDVDLLDYH